MGRMVFIGREGRFRIIANGPANSSQATLPARFKPLAQAAGAPVEACAEGGKHDRPAVIGVSAKYSADAISMEADDVLP